MNVQVESASSTPQGVGSFPLSGAGEGGGQALDDLALLLEIDLVVFGRTDMFRDRLARALHRAASSEPEARDL